MELKKQSMMLKPNGRKTVGKQPTMRQKNKRKKKIGKERNFMNGNHGKCVQKRWLEMIETAISILKRFNRNML